MINLLPPLSKDEIVFGRRNRKLLHWILALWAIIIGILCLAVFGQFYIAQSTRSLEATLKVSLDRIESQKLEDNQKNLETLNNNFKTASQLLGRQILFSELFVKLGSTLPKDTVLTSISLTDKITTTETGIQFTVKAKTKESAQQAFVNISDPKNGLFDDADLIEITKASSGSGGQAQQYPYNASIQTVFKKDSPFILINKLKAESK